MTLVEIMISLLIGAFLIGGVLQIFLSTKQTYRMQESLSRLQENGRFAMDFLTKDIRMAGFIGCSSRVTLTNTLNAPTNYFYAFDRAIEGFESTSASAWTPTMDAVAITSPLGGSDVITIRRADDQSFSVTTHAATTAALTLDATATSTNLEAAGFLDSDGNNNCTIAVASDCSAASVFQVSAVAGSVFSHDTGGSCAPGNSANDLGKTYVDGDVYPINTISYYVRTNPNNQPALYRRIGSNPAEELVEGIENMQILYGEDTDNDGTANYYVPAGTVGLNMGRVVSVRVSLLTRTLEDNIAAQPLDYTYNDATTTPADRRLRRVFTSTIAIRNRLP